MVEMDGQRLWTHFDYWESSAILLVGGVLGILFVILLRRTLVVDAELPFPESYACYEIIRAGQKGATGANYVFGAMGIGALIEFLKNSNGFAIFRESVQFVFKFPASVIYHFNSMRESLGSMTHGGGLTLSTPVASPALIAVGYIIGSRLAVINFCGGVFAWLVLIPLILFVNPNLQSQLGLTGGATAWDDMTYSVWYNMVRPIAVGAMLVGSLYTLWGLRKSILGAFQRAFRSGDTTQNEDPHEKDLSLKWIVVSAAVLVVPMTGLFYLFSGSWIGALVAAIVMTITGFLFAGVGGWLVGLVGGSNQPISGLALSALIVSALLMVSIGVVGLGGVAAVLAVAAVVCCAASMAGDMIQDLKVGHLIGGSPWKMEVSEIISTVIVSFVLVFPIIALHEANIATGGIGIGDTRLSAPQAGLMAQLAKGIVGGEMPWGLIIMGMFFATALIMINAPAPMLIAVGMYLPFDTSFAIFAGGLLKLGTDRLVARRGLGENAKITVHNRGTLIASGFIAGEALMGVLLAILVLANVPSFSNILAGQDEFAFVHGPVGAWLSLLIFGAVGFGLIRIPIRRKSR
jgi:putative OPT family oligopeptide transporter